MLCLRVRDANINDYRLKRKSGAPTKRWSEEASKTREDGCKDSKRLDELSTKSSQLD